MTLNPGVYIIEGGGLSVSGNASLTGNGVLIFNAGSSYNGTTDGGTFGSISLGGNGTINLSAADERAVRRRGRLPVARATTPALSLSGNGAGIIGAIYAPAAAAGLSGNAQLTGSLVVSTLSVSGNAGAFQLADGASSGLRRLHLQLDQQRRADRGRAGRHRQRHRPQRAEPARRRHGLPEPGPRLVRRQPELGRAGHQRRRPHPLRHHHSAGRCRRRRARLHHGEQRRLLS